MVEVENSDREVIGQMGTWVKLRGGNGEGKLILSHIKGRGGHARGSESSSEIRVIGIGVLGIGGG